MFFTLGQRAVRRDDAKHDSYFDPSLLSLLFLSSLLSPFLSLLSSFLSFSRQSQPSAKPVAKAKCSISTWASSTCRSMAPK